MTRAVALIDGEHYAPVVRDALAALPYEFVGAVLVGGTEKLRDDADYGVPLVSGFEGAEIVVDLSDEPVLGPAERFRWVSRVLAAGLPYVGADFRFDPPQFAAVRAAVDRRDRNRQTGRQDRGHRSPRSTARP